MITRYAMSWGKDEDGSIYVSPTEQPKGNWVKYEDYARLQQERVHDLNQIGGLQQELARLKAEVERLESFCTRTIIPNEILKAENEVLQNRCDFLEGRGL